MPKSALILAALALAACGTREESHGEVVDTLIDNSKVTIDMDSTRDTTGLPALGADSTVVVRKPVTGRKPVDMKDSLRRP